MTEDAQRIEAAARDFVDRIVTDARVSTAIPGLDRAARLQAVLEEVAEAHGADPGDVADAASIEVGRTAASDTRSDTSPAKTMFSIRASTIRLFQAIRRPVLAPEPVPTETPVSPGFRHDVEEAVWSMLLQRMREFHPDASVLVDQPTNETPLALARRARMTAPTLVIVPTSPGTRHMSLVDPAQDSSFLVTVSRGDEPDATSEKAFACDVVSFAGPSDETNEAERVSARALRSASIEDLSLDVAELYRIHLAKSAMISHGRG